MSTHAVAGWERALAHRQEPDWSTCEPCCKRRPQRVYVMWNRRGTFHACAGCRASWFRYARDTDDQVTRRHLHTGGERR